MIAKAEVKFVRVSPNKVRQVMNLIRQKDALAAQSLLTTLNKRPCEFLIKILKSAIANAQVKGFNPKELYISKAICNQGPSWKRFKAAAFGRAAPIKKLTSHIKIELDVKS
jgi:large subunit ribosomal protein L22